MIYVITPCFARPALLARQMAHFYKAPPKKEFKHLILDNHYPLPDKETNHDLIKTICLYYGATYVDSQGDLGLQHSLNHAIKEHNIKSDDIICGNDPDDFCSHGWVDAATDVMQDPSVAVCGLRFGAIKDKQDSYPSKTIHGHLVKECPSVEMWNACAFNMKLVHSMGGFSQPNKYYGGIEIALFLNWIKQSMRLVYLEEFFSDVVALDRDDPFFFDPSYGRWKIAHAVHGDQRSFEEYLATPY